MNKVVRLLIKIATLPLIGYGAYKVFLTKPAQESLKSSVSQVGSLALEKIKDTNIRSHKEEQQRLAEVQQDVNYEWERLGF